MGSSQQATLLEILRGHHVQLSTVLVKPQDQHSAQATAPSHLPPHDAAAAAPGQSTPSLHQPCQLQLQLQPQLDPLQCDDQASTETATLLSSHPSLSESSITRREPGQATMAKPSLVGCPQSPLSPRSANTIIPGVDQQTPLSKNRFEMHTSAPSLAGLDSTMAVTTPIGRDPQKTTGRSSPQRTITKSLSQIRIPGFDPSAYGKPKITNHTKVTPTSTPLTVTAPTIHSPTPACSSPDDSVPKGPHHDIHPTTAINDSLRVLPSTVTSGRTHSSPASLHDPPEKPESVPAARARSESDSTGISTLPTLTCPLKFKPEPQQVVTHPSQSSVHITPTGPHTEGRPKKQAFVVFGGAMGDTVIPRHGQEQSAPTLDNWHGKETPSQKLARLRVNELNSINRRNRRKDRDQTASPATLSAIRLPLAPEREQKIAARVLHYHSLGSTSPQTQHSAANSTADLTAAGIDLASQLQLHTPASQIHQSHNPQGNRPQTSHKTRRALTPQVQGGPFGLESDYYLPPHVKPVPPKRNPRWATNEEIKPEEVSENSNAWGSVDPGAVSTDSGDSIVAIHHGNIWHKRVRPKTDLELMGWDGKMQPPPVDWTDRPRFDNGNPEFREAFDTWTETVVERVIPRSPYQSFDTVDIAKVQDTSLHADGIGMVAQETTINTTNAAHYGYSLDHNEALLDSQPLKREELDRIVTMDTTDPANEPVLQETTEIVVQRWLAHNNIQYDSLLRRASTETKAAPARPAQVQSSKRETHPNSPKVAIYLRPAVATDLTQMTQIYNWYVENSPRPAEYEVVAESDLRERFEDVTNSKLPFIVAVMKVRRHARRTQPDGTSLSDGNGSVNGIGSNGNRGYSGITPAEKIVGWACAQNFTAMNYVERTSAELEIYVSHEMERHGVGKCLLDKLLESCDRGYLKRGGYDFECAPEKSYLYNSGGGRDLHKLYFIVRTWSKPRQSRIPASNGAATASNGTARDQSEADSEKWITAWLEGNAFEVEGRMKKVGVKKGRFLDIVHFGRETMWQPEDGHVPDPLPGTN